MGNKNDRIDARKLADLLRCGLKNGIIDFITTSAPKTR
jgi:hypothetical protein